MKIPAHAKYQIIYDTMQKNDNLLNVAAMCEIAGVSRSGYYHYLSTEDQRMEREERDRQDFLLILKAYQYRGYHKGARSIYMRLLHMEPPIVMNIKKIRRLMKKYNLQCPIRKANPYRRKEGIRATNVEGFVHNDLKVTLENLYRLQHDVLHNKVDAILWDIVKEQKVIH